MFRIVHGDIMETLCILIVELGYVYSGVSCCPYGEYRACWHLSVKCILVCRLSNSFAKQRSAINEFS